MTVLAAACSGRSGTPDADAQADPDVADDEGSIEVIDVLEDGDGGPVDVLEEIDPLLITDLVVEPNPNSVLSFWVAWSTNRSASSSVEYGEDPSYGFTRGTEDLALEHRVLVVGCPAETDIHFRAVSRDADGIEAASPDTVHATGTLPDWFPEITLDVPPSGEAQPGVTLMNVSHGTVDLPTL
ncbi:MAG: hypothetical protein JRG91_18695, partial [Deltaproteobacteria bacterium]|nr:hypothetical protein [Deltaproteobacteria bacterium]